MLPYHQPFAQDGDPGATKVNRDQLWRDLLELETGVNAAGGVPANWIGWSAVNAIGAAGATLVINNWSLVRTIGSTPVTLNAGTGVFTFNQTGLYSLRLVADVFWTVYTGPNLLGLSTGIFGGFPAGLNLGGRPQPTGIQPQTGTALAGSVDFSIAYIPAGIGLQVSIQNEGTDPATCGAELDIVLLS